MKLVATVSTISQQLIEELGASEFGKIGSPQANNNLLKLGRERTIQHVHNHFTSSSGAVLCYLNHFILVFAAT